MYKNKNFEFTTRGNGAEIMAHQICWLSVIVCIYFLRVSLHENTRAAIICIMLSVNQREIRKINSLMIRGTKKMCRIQFKDVRPNCRVFFLKNCRIQLNELIADLYNYFKKLFKNVTDLQHQSLS